MEAWVHMGVMGVEGHGGRVAEPWGMGPWGPWGVERGGRSGRACALIGSRGRPWPWGQEPQSRGLAVEAWRHWGPWRQEHGGWSGGKTEQAERAGPLKSFSIGSRGIGPGPRGQEPQSRGSAVERGKGGASGAGGAGGAGGMHCGPLKSVDWV